MGSLIANSRLKTPEIVTLPRYKTIPMFSPHLTWMSQILRIFGFIKNCKFLRKIIELSL